MKIILLIEDHIEILDNLKEFLELNGFKIISASDGNSANITNDLAVITNKIRSGEGTIGKLFMDSVFAEDINQTISKIKQGAGGFKDNMNAASHSFLLKRFFTKKKNKKP